MMKDRLTNFQFLDVIDGELANLGRLAESYFQDDPSTSLIKLRQFAERLRESAASAASRVRQPVNARCRSAASISKRAYPLRLEVL